MAHSRNMKFRYPYGPRPALAGHHGSLSAHIQTCREGWCWEVREDGRTINRGTNAAKDDGMAAARYYLAERLTPEERDNEGDYHLGNPERWQREPDDPGPHWRKGHRK